MFNFFKRKKQQQPVTLGISENDKYGCIAYLDESQEPCAIWYPKPCQLSEVITSVTRSLQNFIVVHALAYQSVWRKHLFFPPHYSDEMIYEQIILCLKQELPVELSELYFDYGIDFFAEKNCRRARVYAVRKSYVDTQVLPDSAFDCEPHCFLRAYHHFTERPIVAREVDKVRYRIRNLSVRFGIESVDIVPDPDNFDDHLSIDDITFADGILDPTLFLLAIGASLWKE